MPSTITHAYIGLDTIEKLNIKPKRIINRHINNYPIYCQNMDILYFYHILLLKGNIIQELGHQFHAKHIFEYFEEMIIDNRKNKDEELFTFIAGLITHYQADRIIHPYINYYSYDKQKNKMIDNHFKMETYLDNYLVNKRQSSNHFKMQNYCFIFDNYTKCQVIEKEIDKIFDKYFKFQKMGSYYYKSIKEMHFIYKHIRHDPTGIKKRIYKLIDTNPFNIRRTEYLSYHFQLDMNEYYLNSNHETWYNIHNNNLPSKKSFFDLYDDVTSKSAYIINQLYHYIFEDKDLNLKNIIGNYSYATGLSKD